MPGEPTQSTIQEMAHMLEIRKMSRHSTVLFLGARAGGLFRSPAFYDAMQRFSKRNLRGPVRRLLPSPHLEAVKQK